MPGFSSIDGISSQLNTTAIVDAIMEFERRPAVLLEQRQAEKTQIVTMLKALEAKFIALGAQLKQLMRQSTFETASVSVSDETYLSGTAVGRVPAGSYDFQVLSLARNHQLASQGFNSESMAELGTGTIRIQVGDGSDKEIVIDATNNSLVGIKQAINDADAGVTASIINDGSSTNPYRLILTADKSGAGNSISVNVDLTGGSTLNFATGAFDQPEEVSVASGSSAAISLGNTASYAGDCNKVYTFTVKGTGSQTVGSDVILIEWDDGSDPENPRTIAVTEADSEIELVGDTADGLKLSFSAGTLTAGDTFQVAAFHPLIQEASDARIAYGPAGGNGSPVLVSSETNTFEDVVNGLNLEVFRETPAGETITVNTDIDYARIKEKINGFIDAYNAVIEFIDKQNTYDPDTEESGTLFADPTLYHMDSSLRRVAVSSVADLGSGLNMLYAIGIRSTASGKMELTRPDRLDERLRENLDDVISLFGNSADSSDSHIEFVSATAQTAASREFQVDIAAAATRGRYEGIAISDPSGVPLQLTSTNNKLRLKVDGVVSDTLALEAKTYTSAQALVEEIQVKIDNDPRIGTRGLTVEWVDNGDGTGYLEFQSSLYGSSSAVAIDETVEGSAFAVLGLLGGTAEAGTDVVGTINGEQADGRGQLLIGKDGNELTEGLKLRITYDPEQISGGVEGSVRLVKGIASQMSDVADRFSRSVTGVLSGKIRAYQTQVEDLEEQIAAIDKRLELRRESLRAEFYAMEMALGELDAQSRFLDSQLAGINLNWMSNLNSQYR